MELLNILLFIAAILCSLYLLRRKVPTQGILSEETLKEFTKKTKIIHYSLLYISILFGMLSVAAYKSLKEGEVFDLSRIRYDFIISIFLSPIILRVTMQNTLRKNNLKICLIGYQNGFFWQTIFSEIGTI
ncbi:MAG TPA: hypothetical protein P5531_02990 [Bacteroidales bacterium]|nr:hypothetical protein [Bacteroidales bacterium]HSA42515.1 hypothetical protein [Bacteroidales bacterium]